MLFSRAMSKLETIVGQNIATLREAAELSREELAARLGKAGVKRLTVWRWEQGETLPTGKNFEALGEALGIEPWTLCVPSEAALKAQNRSNETKLRNSLSNVCRALGFGLAPLKGSPKS